MVSWVTVNHLFLVQVQVSELYGDIIMQYDEKVDIDSGDLMTVEEFKKCVKGGFFIDYDGYGNPVKNNKLMQLDIYPSKLRDIPNDATHIIWYNR